MIFYFFVTKSAAFTHLLFDGARVRAGGTLFAGGAIGPRLRALAHATFAAAAAAAQQADAGHASVDARGAVAVVAHPAGVALAEAAAALAVACER